MPARLLLIALCLLPWLAGVPRIAAAQSSPGADRDPEQVLSAAEAAINGGDDRQAEMLISRLPPGTLGLTQTTRAQIVRSTIALKRGQSMAALQALPSGSEHVPLYGERIEDLRARALFQLGDPVAAARALVQRERYLPPSDSQALAENREGLWRNLLRARAMPDNDNRVAIQDEVTRGWLELASEAHKGQDAGYAQWRARHPGHPAYSRAVGLESAVSAASAGYRSNSGAQAVAPSNAPKYPSLGATAPLPAVANVPVVAAGPGNGVALLVPLTGPYAATGSAVRDGFLNAARQAAPGVRVYDTGAVAEQAVAAYQSALAEGARVIVGPLQKDAVTALARLGSSATPVIALNWLDAGSAAPSNFLQFGLAPEDEARAAAEQAVAQGKQRAVALVPRSDWGRRVGAAFGDHLRELGGQVVAIEPYESGTVDPSKTVSRLLGLDSSQSRHKALSNVLGKETEFDPRRRGDVDFIFLAAKPADSRVILPQLRFFRAGGLPLFATSLIFEGRPVDWTPIRVCDMPWILDTQIGWGPARDATAVQYPEPMRAYPRLVALGTDAWRLASLMSANQLRGDSVIAGASGRLSIEGDGRVHRGLTCGAPPVAVAVSQAAVPASP